LANYEDNALDGDSFVSHSRFDGYAAADTFQLFDTVLSVFSQHYWQDSLDGDSFVSQSRFDVYAAFFYDSGLFLF